MKKTAIYVRVSVLKEEAVSPQMQLDKALQYCQLHDEGYQIFQDLDFSGKNTNRPAFQQMMSLINMGAMSKVVVYRLDRISRSVKDFSLFMDTLQSKGVEFYSITERFDTSTPMGRAMINIMAVFAQMERELISQRVFDTKAKQKADGIKLGMPPFGYRLKVGKHCRWQIVQHEAQMVRMVFNMYATGKWSYQSLANYLNSKIKREIKRLPGQSRRGSINPVINGKWQSSTINSILRNVSYTGITSPTLTIVAVNYKPIISHKIYRQCEEIRNKRSPKHMQYQHSTTYDHPLKGKIFCHCGWNMQLRNEKRRSKVFYFCRNFHKSRHSHFAKIPEILQDIKDYIMTCKIDKRIIQEARQRLGGNSDETETERRNLIRHLRDTYERLQEQYIDGEISKSLLKRKTAEIRMQLQELQPKVGCSKRIAVIDNIPEIIHKLGNSSEANRYTEEVIDIFVEKVVWYRDHIESLKIYDEFTDFFPTPYQHQNEVSAFRLISACPEPKPTIYQIRLWNEAGILPDSRRVGKAKRYVLETSIKRVEEIMRLRKLGYNMNQITKLLNGEEVPVRKSVIARELGISKYVVYYWLRKCKQIKPVGVSSRNELLYNLREAVQAIKERCEYKYHSDEIV